MQSTPARSRVQRDRSPLPFGLAPRPTRDNTGGRVRPYGDDDAAWWAAERAARDEAEEAARVEARCQHSRMQEAADAGLWYDPEMELFDHSRLVEAAEAGLRI